MASHKDKYNFDNILASGFLKQYAERPDAPALWINGKEYNYAELYRLSSRILNEIKHSGEKLIGIYTGNDVHSHAAIIAIAMTGAAYVPLNSKYPTERLNEIIKDAGIKLVLNANEIRVPDLSCEVKNIRVLPETDNESALEFVQQETAYILYTSGTTGIPKGVPISKQNLKAFFEYYQKHYDFNSSDRFLQPYELSFDVSVFSIFCAWNAGASVHVVPEGNAKYIEIFKTIQNNEITVASMVPGILKLGKPFFKDFNFPKLRYSFFSGDALYHSDAKAWKQCLPNGAIHNLYGPTETTIVCTRYIWNEERSAKESYNDIVPLGKPFEGMEFIIIDEEGSVINEINTPGELCFSGTQVIDHYINHTSEESFLNFNNKRYYKTGDIASLDKQSNLIFHGRRDTQVKVNGYRVELLEIENTISTCFAKRSKVIAEKDVEGNHLVAYIESTAILKEDLIEKLSEKLPPQLLPSKYIFVEQFPNTINGKLDLESLKELANEQH